MTQASVRPCRSDMKAICAPSGETAGLVSIAGSSVSRVSRPSATETDQMSLLPERAEKKASQRPSGDHDG